MATREEIRAIVIELLQELVTGTLKNEPTQTSDGDEYNNYVFDGEAFVDRILYHASRK